MKLLMYLLYGNNIAYYHEAKYSVLSALQYLVDNKDDIKIIVVTDQPHHFSDYPVLLEIFDSAQFQQWIGEARYNHRAKNRAMATILERYNSPLIFIDTDTYFVDHPAKLFERISEKRTLLYNQENLIANCSEIYEKLHGTSFLDFNGDQYHFPNDAMMWNSGIIGLLPEHKILLDEALVLLDNFYHLSDGIFVMEQLAISEILRIKTKVSASDDIVVHYFGKEKPFYDRQLDYFFSNAIEKNIIQTPEKINELKLSMPKPSASFRLRKKIKLVFMGIKHKKLKKALLELDYAHFNYTKDIEKITQEVWFAKGIKHLSENYYHISKINQHKQYENIIKILNSHLDFVEKSHFSDSLLHQWNTLLEQYKHS